MCSFFSPGAGLPNDKFRVFEGAEHGSLVGQGTAPGGAIPIGVAVSLVRVGGAPGLDADVAAYNQALDRVERGDPPAVVAAEYRPAGDVFASNLAAECGPVWDGNERNDGG